MNGTKIKTLSIRKNTGVSFEEAKTVFYDVDALLIDDTEHSRKEEKIYYFGVQQFGKFCSSCVIVIGNRKA